MHQQGLARNEFGSVNQVTPYREKGFRQRCRLDHCQSPRHRQALRLRRHRKFRITATIGQGANPVANHIAADPGPHGGDFPCHFEPEHRRCAGRWRVKAGALNNVGAIDAGGCHSNQYLSVCGMGLRPFGNQHVFRTTVFRQINKAHESSPLYNRGL